MQNIRHPVALTLSATAISFALIACDGGAGTSTADNTPPVIAIKSHADNEIITGSRDITLQWTAQDTEGLAGAGVTLNGVEVAVSGSDGSYSADLSLANNANVVEVTATDTTGRIATQTLYLDYPFITLSNGQAASIVIGQADFTSGAGNRSGAPGANTVATPYGNASVNAGVLYIPDYGNNRILGYTGYPDANGADAAFVWGQADFQGALAAETADRLAGPQTVRFSGGRMFIGEYDNGRIDIFNTPPAASTGYLTMDVVVGRTTPTDTSEPCDAQHIASTEDFMVVGTKLIVADSDHNRVLIWNTIPTADGTPADLVLGQADLTSCAMNRDGSTTPAINSMRYPAGVWSDGTRLFVADQGNNRVLVWNTFPTQTGQDADAVLGQVDATSTTRGSAADQMDAPYFLTSNGNQLFVTEQSNHRVLVWDSVPTAQTPADHVLGQADFNLGGVATTQTGFDDVNGVAIDHNHLIVTDGGNSRFLIFEGQ